MTENSMSPLRCLIPTVPLKKIYAADDVGIVLYTLLRGNRNQNVRVSATAFCVLCGKMNAAITSFSPPLACVDIT